MSLPPRHVLADIAPMAERATSIDAQALVRVRSRGDEIAAFVRLPHDVLAGRTLRAVALTGAREDTQPDVNLSDVSVSATGLAPSSTSASAPGSGPADVTVAAADLLDYLAGGPQPMVKDAHWLSPLPPPTGWRRVEVVPDSVLRPLIRSGALLATQTQTSAGQSALLASIVLTARSDTDSVEVPLGPLSALTRMGFLPRETSAAVDVRAGWIRLAATWGSTYVSTASAGGPLLGMLGG